MTTISQNVLDTLVVGIYEDFQTLIMMMIDYEEGIDMVTKKEIITAHQNLKDVILFYQSHSQGMNVILMEEVLIGISHRMDELFETKTYVETPHTIYGEKLLLPEGVTVHKALGSTGFQYIFHHETLGHIGQIVFPKENGNILYFDAQINEEAQTNSASAQILKDIGNMLHKEIVRTH